MEASSSTIFKYKLVGWALLVFNLVVLLILLMVDHELVVMAVNYSFFTLMHLTALTCTIFALKDNRAAMLYPVLISSVFFIAIPLSLWIVCTSNSLYCSVLVRRDIHVSFLDCDEEMRLPLIHSLILLTTVLEKMFEFVLFRQLMKIFERQHCNDHFQQTEIKNAFSTVYDSDDEIVVFEKISQGSGQPTIYDYGAQRPSA